MVRSSSPHRRKTDTWEATILKIAQIASVVLLAWITYLTKASSDRAGIAAIEAKRAAHIVAMSDSVQTEGLDTIQDIIDGQRTKLMKTNELLVAENIQLRKEIRALRAKLEGA